MFRSVLTTAASSLARYESRVLPQQWCRATPSVVQVRGKKMKVKTVFIDEKPDTEEDQAELCPYPKVTAAAPDFKGMAVVKQQFKEIQLSDYKGKWLVLFFYPLDFTFVCPTEITAFSDAADKFRAANCEIVACSTDSHFSHLAWINQPRKEGGLGDMKIPVLADYKKVISQDYGVLHEDLGLAFRGLFLIDPDGKIRHIQVNDLPVGRSVDEVYRLLQAFQFVEKHGEVCPANWQPDTPTINPTPEKAKEYFEKVITSSGN